MLKNLLKYHLSIQLELGLSLFFFLNIGNDLKAQQKERDSLLALVREFEKRPAFEKDTNYLNVINRLSNRYYNYNLDSAMYWADKSQAYCEAIEYKKGIVEALRNKGIVFRSDYNYPKALDLYIQALKLAEEINYKEGIGSLYNSIAIVYKQQKKYGKALSNYEAALRINQETHDAKGVAISLNNIGNVYYERKEFQKALEKHMESLAMRKKLNDKVGISNSYNNIGDVYAGLGKYDTAIHYYSDAEKINTETNNLRGLASDYVSLAKSYLRLNQPFKAIFFANKSIEKGLKSGYLEKVRDAFEVTSDAYLLRDMHDSALISYKQFKIFSDSLDNNLLDKKTERMFAEYEYEKREIALKAEQDLQNTLNEDRIYIQRITIIGLLLVIGVFMLIAYYVLNSRRKLGLAYNKLHLANQDIVHKNEEINQQKEELLKQVDLLNEQKQIIDEQSRTKDTLFAIIGHDMRSPITALKGLMNLVTEFDLSQEEFREVSDKLKGGVEHVLFTLNNLLEWANSQLRGIQAFPSNLSLDHIVQENCDLFSEMAYNKDLKLLNEVQKEAVAWADPDQISLVIRNLISNAIKFTKPGGIIRIYAQQKDRFNYITVEDSGIGIRQEALARLFNNSVRSHTFGTNHEKGTGLGLQLCKDFIEKNNGIIRVESQEGLGSKFQFSIPISKE